MELYKTIRSEASETQIIEKSKFIAHAAPASDRDEADAFVAEIKSRYKDATHNVPAMVLGDKSQTQWASDDGEPQGTSGAPIVQMLVSEGLTNLVVVVTRYFGGIKLGTGGLVRAYTSSAKLAVEAAGICSVANVLKMTCQIDYSYLAKLQNMAAESLSDCAGEMRYVIGEVTYSDKVQLDLMTFAENREELEGMIANITSGTGTILSACEGPEKV